MPAGGAARQRLRALLLIVAFEAGLATGLARFVDPWFVITVLLGLAALHRAPGWRIAAAAALLGVVIGTAGRTRAHGGCAARLPAAPVVLELRLQSPVADGITTARVLGPPCRGAIAVRFRDPSWRRAGSRWLVEGRWIPRTGAGGRPDGVLVAARSSPLGGTPGLVDRLRNGTAGTIRDLYGARTGIVEALLVGSRGGIDPVLNAAFQRSGLVHLLSISGFHVGVLYLWVGLLLRVFRFPRHRGAALAVVVILGYVAFLGWPAPAVRAALLAAVGAWSTARQRNPAAVPLLAVTCLGVTLLDPWALFDLGGWLSAAAFWGALTFTRWSDRAWGERPLVRGLFASVGATVATAPIAAAALGSVALAGVGLNFAAIPLAAAAVPALLLSVLLHPVVRPLAEALAAGAGVALGGLERLATWGSAVPGAAVLAEPGPAAAIPWAAVLLIALWAIGRRNTPRRAALRAGWAAGLAGVVTLVPVGGLASPDEANRLALHFLNVGQGDAVLIRTPRGAWILVDAGPADDRHDAGREVVLPFLVRRGVRRLAAFVLSHAHLDHDGGAAAVVERVPPALILEPAEPVAEASYLALLDQAAAVGTGWRPARAGDSLVVDGVRFEVLHPDTTWGRWREDLNDDSVVLRVSWGRFRAVLAGDLGVRAESLLAGRVGPAALLKVGHHGSAGSSGEPWLAEIAPQVGIVSVGRNRYGHPAPAALARLAGNGIEVWRTDRDGTVSVVVAESSMTVRGRRGTRSYTLRP